MFMWDAVHSRTLRSSFSEIICSNKTIWFHYFAGFKPKDVVYFISFVRKHRIPASRKNISHCNNPGGIWKKNLPPYKKIRIPYPYHLARSALATCNSDIKRMFAFLNKITAMNTFSVPKCTVDVSVRPCEWLIHLFHVSHSTQPANYTYLHEKIRS